MSPLHAVSQVAPPAQEASESELVLLARTGDDGALCELLTAFRPLARSRARAYFLVGADRDDVVQEAMIGLFKAIRDFDPSHEASFRTFADLCITRQILTAVKAAARQKHGPLNDYVPLSRSAAHDTGERPPLELVLPIRAADPADLVVSRERLRALQSHVDRVLSDLEVRVLQLHVEGFTQSEVAARLGRPGKSIDNALQRIKRKLEAHLEARALAEVG